MAEITESVDALVVDGQPGSQGVGDGGVLQVPVINIESGSDSYADNINGAFVLIFNHESFDKNRYRNFDKEDMDRKGTNVDRDSLVETFKALEVGESNVKIVENATYEKIAEEIEIARKFDYTDFGCFICCILTHGDESGVLYAYDRVYSDEIIFEAFRGNNCPSLVGKPKIFFIQACCGKYLDDGCRLATLESDGGGDVYIPEKIPNTADFLVHRSTVPGYYSWRNTVNGSWFIQALTSVLKKAFESSNPDDLLSLLTVVNRKVAYEFESRCNEPKFNGKKQQPSVYHTLTRKIYFSTFSKRQESEIAAVTT